jgi:adenylate kinase family enzyme
VPLLGPDAVPPGPARRVLVAGTSGSGKTTLARRIAARLNVPHVEIDGLFHGPGWTPDPDFVSEVGRFSAGPAWVTEWQYTSVRPLLAERADLLVWLDHPRRLVLWQVVRRTLRRRLRREQLWNGNVEPPLWTVLTARDHIIRWSWRTHRQTAPRVEDLLRSRLDLPVVRLRSRAAARRWLSRLAQQSASSQTDGGSRRA